MIESIRQEAMRSIDNVNEFKSKVERLIQDFEDVCSENRGFYRFMEDRVDYMKQINTIEDQLHELRNLTIKHIESLEESMA